MARAILRQTAALAWVLTATNCRTDESPATAEAQSQPPRSKIQTAPPEVEFAGCLTTTREPLQCGLHRGPAQLSMWVGSATTPIIRIDDVPAKGWLRPADDGSGWTAGIQIPADAERLTVTAADSPAWTLTLAEAPPTPTVDRIVDRYEKADDRAAAVRQTLESLRRELPELEGFERARASLQLVRLHFWLGDRAGGIAVGQDGLRFALDHGQISVAIDIAIVLLQLHYSNHDELNLRFLLDLTELYLPQVADEFQAVRWHYYRARWGQLIDNLGLSHEASETSGRIARRLGLVEDEIAALGKLASLSAMMGRSDESATAADRLLSLVERGADDACTDASALSSAGWGLSIANLLFGYEGRAGRLLERSLHLYGPGGGCDARLNRDFTVALQETRFNYAFDALARGDMDALRKRLELIDEELLTEAQRTYVATARARLLLADEDPMSAWVLLGQTSTPPHPVLAWYSAVLRGEVAEALGRPRDALRAYMDAEKRVEEAISATGFDQGREGIAAGFRLGTVRAIRLQLDEQDPVSALATARRSRARTLRPIDRASLVSALPPDARRQWHESMQSYRAAVERLQKKLDGVWTLPSAERRVALRRIADERDKMRTHLQEAYAVLAAHEVSAPPLKSPPSQETWLLYHPLEKGWAAFAMRHDGVGAHVIEAIPADADASWHTANLLEPFAADIRAAKRLRFLPMDATIRIPLHALPWDDDVLIADKPVAYSLDAGPRLDPQRPGEEVPQALVVAEPASRLPGVGRLPRAQTEADTVVTALSQGGWRIERLQGNDATYSALVAQIVRSDWLHYAGHAAAGGFAGWDSALALAGEATLDVRSILSLPRVPRTVLLSGCETGRTDVRYGAGGIHLAAAFLLAGSQAVVAATEEIADKDALALARAFYEQPPTAAEDDTMRRFKNAVELFRSRRPTSDAWSDLRVWTP